jgi:hypothetical protein
MDTDNPILIVSRMVDRAEEYLDEQSKQREQALEYYEGKPSCIDYNEGRSFSVSKDLRATVKKLMPSVMRMMFGSEKAVQCEPVGPEDEESAQQASDYVNHIVMRETQTRRAIESAIFDAIVLKTGILEWCATEKTKVVVTEHKNLSDEAVLGLFDDENNEVFDYTKEPETDPAILAIDPNAMRHSFKIRRREKSVVCELKAVPRGSFLISPNARSIEDAPLVGKKMEAGRSDLVAEGYDKEQVYRLACVDGRDDDDDFERYGDDWTDLDQGASKAGEDVEYYEVYARLDYDGDGIAELYRVVYGLADRDGGGDEINGTDKYIVLASEPCDEAPFADIAVEYSAHQFEGHSVFEDIEDIQRIKTVLLRATLDNLNWQNNAQRAVVLDAVENPEAVQNPQFGQDIFLKRGNTARDAIAPVQVPFFAANSFEMMQYMDDVREDRTGINDASGGVDFDNIANTSATAAQIATEAGVAQADMIVRNLAHGIGRAFKGLLKLIVSHHDKSRIVRLRGQWVEYRPDSWNADMDCVVNTGLGGGTRERDMQMLNIIMGLQREIVSTMGLNNPLVKPDQIYATLEKITETAGFTSAEPFFTKPDPQEVAAKVQEMSGQDPQAGQADQAKMQMEQAKVQMQRQKAQADVQLAQQKAQAEMQLAREKMQAEIQLSREKMQAELQMARERMRAEAAFGQSMPRGTTSPIRMGGQVG